MSDNYSIETNTWEKVVSDPRFLAGRSDNTISYLWDGLIESVTQNYIEGTLEIGNEIDVSDYEQMARIMASENRFQRRVLVS